MCLQLAAQLFRPSLVHDFRQCLDYFDAHFALGPGHEGHQCIHHLRVAQLAQGADDDGHGLGVTRLEHFQKARHRAFAADLGQRVDGALADPPILVARGGDERLDGTLILRLVQDLDGRAANVVVLVPHQLQNRIDDLRPADLAQGIRGAAAHPPVAVLDGLEQVLHRFRVTDLVQDLDGGPPRVLILVLEYVDQKTDGVRVVGLDDDVDGLVLHIDLGILQQRAHPFDIDLTVHALQRRERGSADQLVGILQQRLQRGLHLGCVVSREQIDDVHAGDGVLALHPAEQLGNGRSVCDLADDAEQRRFLVRLLRIRAAQQFAHAEARFLRGNHLEDGGLGDPGGRQRLQQQVRREVAATRQRPGDSGDDPRAALDEPLHEQREGLLADQAAQCLDERQRRVLVGIRQSREHRFDRPGTEFCQSGHGLLSGRAGRIGGGSDLGDQPVGTQITEKAHSAFPLRRRFPRALSDLKYNKFQS